MPRQVYRKYRRRFGIEASYRLLRRVKVLTNSRNPALRFACFRKLLVRAVERYYPPPLSIPVFVSPQSVIHWTWDYQNGMK